MEDITGSALRNILCILGRKGKLKCDSNIILKLCKNNTKTIIIRSKLHNHIKKQIKTFKKKTIEILLLVYTRLQEEAIPESQEILNLLSEHLNK